MFCKLSLSTLLAFLIATPNGFGQIVSSSLGGTIKDRSGSAISGAKVTVANEATGIARGVVSDGEGNFTVPQLAPGPYRITAEAAGFKQAAASGITLLVDQTARLDLILDVGDITEKVEVTASAALVQSETSSVGQVIERRQVVDLPLNGRNFLQLANISPGVAPAYNARSATITNQSGRSDMAVHISGGRGDTNSYLIDGVETRSTWFNSPSVLLSVDAIQEFKVDRNLFAAEYGQGSGLVSMVSKSGANAIHGSVYEFVRNDKMDAANYFDNYFGAKKAPFRQNQFGAAAGGAIIKNRLFYFGSWESLRSRRSNTLSAQVPTAVQLTGDLSGTNTPVIDPLTGVAFPGNVIPSNRLSGVTQKFIAYTPAPNNTVGNRNYVVSKSTNRNDDQFGGRMDYQITPNDSLFGRITDYDSTLFRPGTTALSGSVFPYSGRNIVVQYTRILSPQLLNNLKFGYNHAQVYNSWEVTPNSIANDIGLNIKQVPEEYGLPSPGVTGGLTVGGGAGINQGGVDNLFQFSDTLSWVKGRHTFKVGTDIRVQRFDLRLGLNNNGAFTFDGRYTGAPLGDFLLGNPASMTAQIGLGVGRFRWNSYNFFGSDDFKITSRLTLNLGLRYEYDHPPAERDHKEGYFDTSLNQFVVGISKEQSPIQRDIAGLTFQPSLRPGIWIPDRNNFAPRIGLAYRLTDRSTLRGGYGFFYAKTQGNELQFKLNAPPIIFAASLTGNAKGVPTLSWDRDAFPDPASPSFPVSTLSPFSVDPRDRTPYIQQWNLSVDQALSKNMVLELAYVGSKGTHLAERVNINQAVLPDPSNITPIATRRRFTGFGDILSANFQENSFYNALQARLERRFDSGFSYLVGYTFSKSIDTASRGSGGSWHQNAYRLRDDRGPSDFDVRHRLTVSG
ncbi:MAG: TonB-dependent receptor, partial [Bryobacteraceae bacterium]